jgi:hypothetical protein
MVHRCNFSESNRYTNINQKQTEMKKKFLMGAYVLAIYAIVIMVMLTSCSHQEARPPVSTEMSKDLLNSEYLGRVGQGTRGDFDLYRFEVDGVIYIVGSEYNGGMALIDKIEKP